MKIAKTIICSAALGLAVAVAPALVQARVVMPGIFTDNMVLQRNDTITLFGTADKGKRVTVKAGWGKEATAIADAATGKWSVKIATSDAGGPYTITVSDGKKLELKNVMLGEVWFCSGQSNMEMPIAGWGKIKDYEKEIAAADYPNIRLYLVKQATSVVPIDKIESPLGGWQECSPATVPEFSSLAYFFARRLWQELGVPVGVVASTWGGTPAEAWTSAETLKGVYGYSEKMAALEKTGFARDAIMANYHADLDAWKSSVHKIDKGYAADGTELWTGEDFDDTSWDEMNVPSYLEQSELSAFDGVVWFRRTVDVPQEWAGKELNLDLGAIDDEDIVYWNGKKIAEGSGYNWQRHYTVPSWLVKAGRNVITVRDFDTGGEGGLTGPADAMALHRGGEQVISLAGAWKYRVGCSLADMPAVPMSPESSSFPTTLFNAMVNPWLQYRFKGVIWYQGEANVGRADEYETLFKSLIFDWRKHFGDSDMPFYFVQLANYLQRADVQPDSQWAALREAQASALGLENTGMMVNIDLGEATDIHPKNKQEVGRRLSALALAYTYGLEVPAEAPVYDGYEVVGDRVRVSFSMPAKGEPLAQSQAVEGFTIAGPDRVFHKAQAYTDGGVVVVYSPEVAMPVAVRYGWADNPECTLQTASGFHVAPFRTDNW